MRRYQVYLEIDESGYCAAHVPELLGLYVFSDSKRRTLEMLPSMIKEYRLWLKRHGEAVRLGRVEFEIAEEKLGTCPRISGNQAALFSFDLIPPTKKEIRRWLRRAKWNRQEMLKAVSTLPDGILDRKEEGKRSIGEVLDHVANCDWWYVTRLGIKLPEDSPRDILAKLRWAREIATAALVSLAKESMTQIVVPTKYCGATRGEQWTARKVFRRLLEHEREHIENIKQIIAGYHQ
jgi:predicted RNase H-like HicB family nuclease